MGLQEQCRVDLATWLNNRVGTKVTVEDTLNHLVARYGYSLRMARCVLADALTAHGNGQLALYASGVALLLLVNRTGSRGRKRILERTAIQLPQRGHVVSYFVFDAVSC